MAPAPPQDPDRRLARLAARQHGLVTRGQALSAGLSRSQVHQRARTGRWRRVLPGVYAIAGTPATFHQRVLAACLAAGPGAVASHRTAAHLLGIDPFAAHAPGAVDLLVLRPSHPRLDPATATLHRTLDLPQSDLAAVRGIPVTRPARTLVDLAAHCTPAQLAEAVDDAVIRGLVSLDRLHARLRAMRSSGRPGSPRLDAVLATWRPDAMPDQVAEMRLVRRLAAAGVPPPELQHEVWHRDRLVARLDLAWPAARCGYELDSRRWHSSPAAHQRDLRRHNALRVLGWTVFQVTPAQVADTSAATTAELAGPVLAVLGAAGIPEGGARPCA